MRADGSISIFAGLRVVDLTSGMAGPLVSMLLADHGADVIKVERPCGDWARGLQAFSFWNRGKRSVQLDLGSSEGRDSLALLLLGADVFVADDAERVLERVGLDRTRLSDENPGLVRCSISGFGPHDSSSVARPYEGIVAATTGRMTGLDTLSGSQPGVTHDGPVFTAAPVASYGASQLALQGVVAALLQRRRTGAGQHVATSLLEGAIAFVMRQELGRGDSPEAAISEVAKRGIELCFVTAECKDGRYIQMCARQDHHFHEWLRAVGLSDLLDDPRFSGAPLNIASVDDVDELESRLRQQMKTRTQSEWMEMFSTEFDVGADPFLSPEEFLAHPDMVENDRVVELDDITLGRVRQLGPLVQMESTPSLIDRGAPALGASNNELSDPWALPRLTLPEPTEDVGERRPPLEGTTLLEVAYFIAGPLATSLLAELGARVIKIEPLGGDPYRRTGLQSAKFVHGKESLTLDLKHDEGRSILEMLIARSDVVVHSFRSAAAEKLGLDAATVLALKPEVVHLYAASYGSRGPQRDRAAFHSTPNALTGGGIKQAGTGNPPVNDSYADPGSALGAATGILFGLWARELTGTGQSLETTMLASTGYIHSSDMVISDSGGSFAVADGAQRGLGPRYRLYRCSEGDVFVAAVQDHEWRTLLSALGQDDLYGAAPDDAGAKLEGVFATDTAQAWEDLLSAEGIGVSVVFLQGFDDWLKAEGMLEPVEHVAFGRYWRLPPKVRMSGSDSRAGAACSAGEHSAALLADLGFASDAIEALASSGVTSLANFKGETA